VSGEYTAYLDDKEIILKPGDELLIPRGQNNGENAKPEQENSCLWW